MKLTARNMAEEVIAEADIPAEWFTLGINPETGEEMVTIKPEHMDDVAKAYIKVFVQSRKEKP